jgi:hypothetical protein
MKVKHAVSKLLANKLVLNIVAIIAFINVFSYMVVGNLNNVFFFIILSILVRYFSKNMIIVLGIPLIIVNLYSISMRSSKEGLENSTNKVTTNKDTTNKDTTNKTNTQSVPSTQENSDTTTQTTSIASVNDQPTVNEQFELNDKRRKSKIDYASTIEDAYDDLNKILGGGGVKQLTQDTQGLMKQQLELAKSMEAMTPLIKGMMPMINQAQGMLNNLNDTSNGGLGNIMNFAKNLSSKGEASPVTNTN